MEYSRVEFLRVKFWGHPGNMEASWWSRSNAVMKVIPPLTVKVMHQVLQDARQITEYYLEVMATRTSKNCLPIAWFAYKNEKMQ